MVLLVLEYSLWTIMTRIQIKIETLAQVNNQV